MIARSARAERRTRCVGVPESFDDQRLYTSACAVRRYCLAQTDAPGDAPRCGRALQLLSGGSTATLPKERRWADKAKRRPLRIYISHGPLCMIICGFDGRGFLRSIEWPTFLCGPENTQLAARNCQSSCQSQSLSARYTATRHATRAQHLFAGWWSQDSAAPKEARGLKAGRVVQVGRSFGHEAAQGAGATAGGSWVSCVGSW